MTGKWEAHFKLEVLQIQPMFVELEHAAISLMQSSNSETTKDKTPFPKDLDRMIMAAMQKALKGTYTSIFKHVCHLL